ncbi:MAG: glycoside hydrolase family 3 protein, partial [Actinobacteria bacterium]|nr:glycoside hydrolase family 3 protein [Actinomycetota bacterium]
GQLASAGVNLDLAPVGDTVPQSVGTANKPIGFYHREYGYTPAAVTAAGTAVVQGMQEAGISATIKHFPGLGRASGNTDTTIGVTDTVTTSNDPYLQPFTTAVRSQGVPVVMVSEAIYTKIDASQPAVFSPTVLGGMLRTQLGFHGVIMSDSLDAAAVSHYTLAQRAVDFINAGGDVVLVTNPGDIPTMYNAVVAEVNVHPAFAAKVNQAALQVLIGKEQTGLMGGTLATASSGNGNITLVERAGGHTMVAFMRSGSHWTGGVSLGGSINYQPAAAAVPGTTTTEVAFTGTNGAVNVMAVDDSGTHTAATSIGAAATGPPAIAATSGGQLVVAVRSTNHSIYVNTYAPATGWSGWTSIGGEVLATPIALTYTSSGDLDAFVTGTNDAIYENVRHAGAWSGWTGLGGVTVTGGPTAITRPDGALEIFVRGTGGTGYERHYSGSWSPWGSIGGILTSSPAAAAPASGTSWVVGNLTDGRLWQKTFSGGTWSGWSPLPFG